MPEVDEDDDVELTEGNIRELKMNALKSRAKRVDALRDGYLYFCNVLFATLATASKN